MSMMMMTLMAEFQDLRKKNDSLGYSLGMNLAESYVNNCHGMNADDTLNKVGTSLGRTVKNGYGEDNPEGLEALNDALGIVKFYEELLVS